MKNEDYHVNSQKEFGCRKSYDDYFSFQPMLSHRAHSYADKTSTPSFADLDLDPRLGAKIFKIKQKLLYKIKNL